MNRLSVFHIETILWISRLGTFSAAAERLNTTQPAISARVKEVESQLGWPIFQKVGRRMMLTARGKQLARDCEHLWLTISRTLQLTTSDLAGLIKIGSGEIVATTCVPPLLVSLSKSLARARFELEIDLSQGLLHKLLAGTCDLILLVGPIASPEVRAVEIGSIELVWAMSATIDIETDQPFENKPIWLLHRASPIHRVAMQGIHANGLAANPVHTSNNVRAIIDILLAGGGLALLPKVMIGEHLASGTLRLLQDAPTQSVPFVAAVRSTETDPLVLEVFKRASQLASSSKSGK